MCGKSPAKGIGWCHHFDETIRRNSNSIRLRCKGMYWIIMIMTNDVKLAIRLVSMCKKLPLLHACSHHDKFDLFWHLSSQDFELSIKIHNPKNTNFDRESFQISIFVSKGERTGCTRASTTSLCGVATAHRGNSIDVGTWCWYQRCWRLRIQCIAFVQRTRVSLSHIVKRSNQSSCQVLSHHLLFYDENRLHNDCNEISTSNGALINKHSAQLSKSDVLIEIEI